MKAAVCRKYGAPENLIIEDIEAPAIGSNDILVKVFTTCVTSSDCYIRGFNVPLYLKPLMGLMLGFRKPRQPVLGMVFSGVVTARGKNVRGFQTGTEVFGFDRFGFGCYADYKKINTNGVVIEKPPEFSHIDTAGITYGGLLAQYYLKKASIELRKKILIIGASGAVGSSAVQLAKDAKTYVVGVCGTDNINYVSDLGADRVIDYRKNNYLNQTEKYDLIFDAVPAAAVRKINRADIEKLLEKNGVYISVRQGTPGFSKKDLEDLVHTYLKKGLKPGIGRVMKIEEIAQAHRYAETWHKRGNLVIEIGET